MKLPRNHINCPLSPFPGISTSAFLSSPSAVQQRAGVRKQCSKLSNLITNAITLRCSISSERYYPGTLCRRHNGLIYKWFYCFCLADSLFVYLCYHYRRSLSSGCNVGSERRVFTVRHSAVGPLSPFTIDKCHVMPLFTVLKVLMFLKRLQYF